MRDGFAFSTRFKVRYAEIDGQKIVFNSRYLEYADVAITDFWEWTGIESVPEWGVSEFNVRRTEIDYLAPFRWGDEIEAFVKIDRIGTTSLTKVLDLCHAATGELHTSIRMVSVHVDLEAHRPVPFAAPIRAYLEKLVAG